MPRGCGGGRGAAGFEKKKSLPSNAPNKPISLRTQGSERGAKNEIFLDLLERLTVLFSASGSIVRCEINGAIVMKSFLHGSPGQLGAAQGRRRSNLQQAHSRGSDQRSCWG